MRIEYYILEGKYAKPVLQKEWAEWFENSKGKRHVADETIESIRISTVFLGLDHSFGDGPLRIFETMIFGGPLDSSQWRCATWVQAEQQHQMAVRRVREQLNDAKRGGDDSGQAK